MNIRQLHRMLQARRSALRTSLSEPESRGLIDVLQTSIAPIFGIGASTATAADEDDMSAALECIVVAYAPLTENVQGSLLAPSVVSGDDHLPSAALFINVILDRIGLDGFSAALTRQSLNAVHVVCAALPSKLVRLVLPGVASKLLAFSVKRLRQRGGGQLPLSHAMDRVTVKAIETITDAAHTAFTDAPEGWADAAFAKLYALCDPLLRTLTNVVVESHDVTDPTDESGHPIAASLIAFADMSLLRIPKEPTPTGALELLLILSGTFHFNAGPIREAIGVLCGRLACTPWATTAVEGLLNTCLRGELGVSHDARRRVLLLAGTASAMPELQNAIRARARAAFRICGAAASASSHAASRGSSYSMGALNFLTSVAVGMTHLNTVKSTCSALAEFLRSVVTPMLDDWDDWRMHEPLLQATRCAFQHIVTMPAKSPLAKANLVAFGGLWQGVWDLTGRTQHVWHVELHWDECSLEQRSHRTAVVTAAVKCCVDLVSTCVLPAQETETDQRSVLSSAADAHNVCLMALIPRLLELCASSANDDIRQAALKGLHRMGRVLFPTAPSDASACAYLITRCIDYVSDAVLLSLSGFDSMVDRTQRSVRYRSHPEADDDEDDGNEQDRDVACTMLHAFFLICADAMNEDTALALDVGARLHSFVHAALTRLNALIVEDQTGQAFRERLLHAMCAAAGFIKRCQSAFDQATAAAGGLPRLPAPARADEQPPDPRDLCYDRCLPRWLTALHQVACASLDVVVPMISSGATSSRLLAIRFCGTMTDAIASSCGSRRVAGEEEEASNLATGCEGRRLSDNYLVYAHRYYMALVACLESVKSNPRSPQAAGALQALAIAQRLGQAMAPSENVNMEEKRQTLSALFALPLVTETSAACVEACTALLDLAPSFLSDRVANQFSPLAIVHYVHHCGHRDGNALQHTLWTHPRITPLIRAPRLLEGPQPEGQRCRTSTLRGQRLESAVGQLLQAVKRSGVSLDAGPTQLAAIASLHAE